MFTDEVEPTPAELAEIEREWPLIEAEVAVVEAEIMALCAHPGPSELDWQRLRSARRRMLREAAAYGHVGLSPQDAARTATAVWGRLAGKAVAA